MSDEMPMAEAFDEQENREEPADPYPSGLSEKEVIFGASNNLEGGGLSDWVEALVSDEDLRMMYMGQYQPSILGALASLEHDIRRCGITEACANRLVGDPDDPDDGGLLGEVISTQLLSQNSIYGYEKEMAHDTVRSIHGDGTGDRTVVNLNPAQQDDDDN